MRSSFCLLATLFTFSATAYAQVESEGLTLLGSLAPHGTSYADSWGYTAPDGTEYALLCDWFDGLSIIDITNDQPVEVGYFDGSGDGFDVKVYEHYAYLAHGGGGPNLRIIDLSDPTNPTQVGTVPQDAHNIAIEGDYLYMMGGDPSGLAIYSLQPDPTSPQLVGTHNPYYYHDILVRGDTLYAAAIFGEGIDILDISDRSNPSLIANFNYPGSGAHNICSTEDGSHIFVGDEIGSNGQWTRTFDVRDPHNATLVSELIVNTSATVHNCYVKDDILYMGHYSEGTRVWDVRNPENPIEIAYYKTSSSSTWAAYPYFESEKIIASDIGQGLLVFELDVPTTNTEYGPSELPEQIVLEPAYPNPFNPSTTLRFSLEESTEVKLSIVDALGRDVQTILQRALPAGSHEAVFDAEGLPSGLYIAVLEAAGQRATQRITLLK